ncbi:hypothetical protein D918_00633 [Trichuris suis]|nr:hypothetical protein D918_00633 [Trichuris suis]
MTWYPFVFAFAVFLVGIPVMHIITAIKKRNWGRLLAVTVREKARSLSQVYMNVQIP